MNKTIIEWAKNDPTKNNEPVFKYILFKCNSWYRQVNDNDIEDISNLKFLNLVFLLNTTDPDYYYNLGFRFKAYPSGAFETSLFEITKSSKNFVNCNIKTCFSEIDEDVKLNIDKHFNDLKMKNYYLVNHSASSLTDIIHKYSCWIIPYNNAIRAGKYCADISIDLMNCEKFYYA